MKILYNGIYCEQDIIEDIISETNTFPFAQQKLEKLIIDGIIKNKKESDDITILSTRPILRYPKYKKICIKCKETKKDDIKIIYLKFINLPILKQITTFFAIIRQCLKWSKKYKNEEKNVIIYGTNPLNVIPYMMFRKVKNYKIITIVTEIDRFRLLKQGNLILKIKNSLYRMLSKFFANSFDGYILVTKNMNEHINKYKKPYLIIEGMVCENSNTNNIEYKERENIIMYAGSLHKKYGINKLVEAFETIGDSNYKLLIYGEGDYKETLIQKSKMNSNIIYAGIANNEDIIKLECKAKILVNPRPSNEEFTKFSFPSKTLEYFSTGTVSIITKLEGISKEYFNYCYTFDEETVEGMSEKLKSIMRLEDAELEHKAKQAKEFVLKNKNNIVQTKKILDFIYKL